MNWPTHAHRSERTPCLVVEVDLDWIEGDSAASVAATNPDDSLCYRTPATTDQGDLPVTFKTRRWMTSTQRPIPELGAIPCLNSANIAAEEVRVGRGLGFFGQATIDLIDFADDDRREDPFYGDTSRDDVDHAAGTYFGKLMARNPWWTGRKLRVIEGWTTDGVWHERDSITHHYLIRDVQGPTNGRFSITAAGPLQLLNLSDIEAPAPSEGVLELDITALAAAARIADPVIAEDYPGTGLVRIGDEVIQFIRTGQDLALTRHRLGTVADDHTAGDSVQLCLQYIDTPVSDIIADLLTTYGGVDPALLALDEWAEEQATWLNLYILGGVVSQPTKVLDLVQELLEASACVLWWDDARGQVRLRAQRPAVATRGTWGDRFHLLAPPAVKRDLSERVSRTDVLIDLRAAHKDPKDSSSYRVRLIGIAQGEEATQHKDSKVRLIATRWIAVGQIALAARASFQVTSQLRDGRQTIVVEVAAKDAARQIGDVIDIVSRDIVDRSGQPQSTRCIITKREAVMYGSKYRYTLERVPFGIGSRFAFYTDDDCPDYEFAAEWQRDPGGFYANADGSGFGPNDPPYLYG